MAEEIENENKINDFKKTILKRVNATKHD